MPIQLVKSYIERFKQPPKEAILTYALDHLVLRKEPWILEMTFELPWILCGSEAQLKKFKGTIKKALNLRYLKKIIFQIELGKEAFLHEYGEDLREKTDVVARAEILKHFKKNYNKDRVKILFVNSGNRTDERTFYTKGGAEVVEAFLRLQEIYRDDVELVLRTVMPKKVKERLSHYRNIKSIERIIPLEELEREWKSADIFVHPHYGNMSHVIIEALSYGLPVVTTDAWATPELIEDGKTGFLVHNPKATRFTEGTLFHFLDPKYIREIMKGPDPQIVEGLVEKLSILIENYELRRRMGETARKEVNRGRFSLKRRNEKLLRILEAATDR